ncbi:MAG: GNAT family N-acetyltransferase [Candidatus Poribacteria bacterium]|nr:GNAT family N-acetyltransferase [Candidatus Poribacteria bacterium]
MRNTIVYRHWMPGDDDAVLAFRPNTNEDWFRHKFDDEDLEPEGIRLAFLNERVVGHVMGELTTLGIEGKVQKFGEVMDVFVAPDMRRQGIATRLMQEVHTYFERRGCCGSILDLNTETSRRLYRKVGYQEVTRTLRTQLLPNSEDSQLKWTDPRLEDLKVLHQLDKRWSRQNFRVLWAPGYVKVNQSNLNNYRVLRRDSDIIGYAEWSESSEGYPSGLIWDPIVPNVDPIEVIKSIQAVIPTPLAWWTCTGSRYENPLRHLGCLFEETLDVKMIIFFGQQIDLTQQFRTFS